MQCSLSDYSPQIIILNETSNTQNNIKLLNYYCIQHCSEPFSGVAILIRKNIQFTQIPTHDNSSIAIKILTSLGPLIIYTQYSPPRENFLNTIPLNKILNFNLPTLIVGDFNAKNPIFHNGNGSGTYKLKGNILKLLMNNQRLNFLGPDFNTCFTHNGGQGKPDIILGNNKLLPYHYQISQGKYIGSDHLPLIIKLSVLPILSIKKKTNLKSLDTTRFKSELQNHKFSDLNNKKVEILDDTLNEIIENIQKSVKTNTKQYVITVASNYIPNSKTKQKLKQVESAFHSLIFNGYPNINVINIYKNDLDILIRNETRQNWNTIIEIAQEHYGKPAAFWNTINRFLGKNQSSTTHLTNKDIIDDNSDTENEIIDYIEPKEKAEFMSNTWRNIFKPHNSDEFVNNNTILIDNWFINNSNVFQSSKTINMNNLQPLDPLMRPINFTEFTRTLKNVKKHKAPGPSGITFFVIQHLPFNYFKIIINIYNAIISSKYWPLIFKTSNMIFAPKPGKDHSNPLNYRPISLLETLAKLLGKILTNRLLYYLEFNNIIPEKQFGFRPSRSTLHSIYAIKETLSELRKQGKTILTVTKDITKAFDTVWLEGLIYKMNQILKFDNDFTALIFNYLFNRRVIPYFSNTAGAAFTPIAGVPQGSCLGPIVFLIHVHDLPPPIYPNSQHLEFADDLIHLVCSDGKGKNKTRDAINKLENELRQTQEWEQNWKIKTSIDKCKVNYTGTTINKIEEYGGVIMNDEFIPVSNPLKILGYSLNNSLSEKHQIDHISSRAKYNLTRLYRFRSAPPKIKKQLYLTLIRPIIEYPNVELHKAAKTHMQKLQRVQNKCLRFICNASLRDCIPSKNLHEIHNLDPINIRLAKLAKKQLYKMKQLYLNNDNGRNLIMPFEKLSPDYNLTQEPLKAKTPSIFENIQANIYIEDSHRKLSLLQLPDNEENFVIPEAKY